MLDTAKLGQFVGQVWNDSIVPTLVDYIRIPNKSPAFDPDWTAHGHMEAAVGMFERWARERLAGLPGATLEIVRLPGRTPLILIEVPGSGTDTVLLYGHLDKQPEMVGWAEGYGPWQPRVEGDKLYGRGGADDGYAMFAALTALAGLREQGIPHGRCGRPGATARRGPVSRALPLIPVPARYDAGVRRSDRGGAHPQLPAAARAHRRCRSARAGRRR